MRNQTQWPQMSRSPGAKWDSENEVELPEPLDALPATECVESISSPTEDMQRTGRKGGLRSAAGTAGSSAGSFSSSAAAVPMEIETKRGSTKRKADGGSTSSHTEQLQSRSGSVADESAEDPATTFGDTSD